MNSKTGRGRLASAAARGAKGIGVAMMALSFSVALSSLETRPAQAQQRTFFRMPTGNHHGFQIFDRSQRKITTFLEHPYERLAPINSQRTSFVRRRNLAHDMYLGVQVGGVQKWLDDQSDVVYESQTNIIRGRSTQGGLETDVHYFAPFGYEGNGLIMVMRAQNTGSSSVSARLYGKVNMKLGNNTSNRSDPNSFSETVVWNGGAGTPHATETGPGGGHFVYVPLGGFTKAGCGANISLDSAVRSGGGSGDLPVRSSCNAANDQVFAAQHDVNVPAGGEVWWGVAVLFVNDTPNAPVADKFRDPRGVSGILAEWQRYAGADGPQQLHQRQRADFNDYFRPSYMPGGLDDKELRLWRQAESVLRMGQIREDDDNYGMLLAALPPGNWHIGWVRDGAYAIVAAAMTGHFDVARAGVDFFLGASAGFFHTTTPIGGFRHLPADYRVSAVRYFGNGEEEGDYNQGGAEGGYNVETDGWGLTLWAARAYLQYSCDFGWLDTMTSRGDTVYEALREIAIDIEEQIVNDLPIEECGIWEVHWDNKKVFTNTVAAQIRGMHDFADIAEIKGDQANADKFRRYADQMLERAKDVLIHADGGYASDLTNVTQPKYVDGSTVEMLLLGMHEPGDPEYRGTLESYLRIKTPFGGYQRLEDGVKLWGAQKVPGVYDKSEWILLDLRIAEAFRRAGNDAQAERLIQTVTDISAANDNLIAELYDRDTGAVAGDGSTPMVGYGSGAWMVAKLESACGKAADYHDDLNYCVDRNGGNPITHCQLRGVDVPPPTGGDGDGDGDGTGGDGGGTGGDGDGTGGGDGSSTTDDEGPAGFCTVKGAGSGTPPVSWLLAVAAIALLWRRRR